MRRMLSDVCQGVLEVKNEMIREKYVVLSKKDDECVEHVMGVGRMQGKYGLLKNKFDSVRKSLWYHKHVSGEKLCCKFKSTQS